ncbi:relaxase/mobilization nuclease domain-containing protein [Echinicola rosea]|nr:relaxase/mobilization nuclease domain-containing protein [Echinicola rosea]
MGRNILGLLCYNEDKVKEGKATVLSAHGFGSQGKDASIREKHQRFRFFTDQNPRAKLNAFHISLNFSPKDQLDEHQLRYIAQQYMERIGFGAQPFLVYRHHDSAHMHVHIVSTNITGDGKRIETHNLGKLKSEKARKELEQELGLVKAEGQQEQRLRMEPLEPVVYGKRESKAAMANIITEVMRTYSYTSLGEFSALLGQFNIAVIQGGEGSRMKANKGLAYSILDEKGNRIGVPIKASAFYARPTMARLQKRMERNGPAKQRLVPVMRKSVEAILRQSAGKGMGHFQQALKRQGLAAHFHYSKTGEVFGLTFIDHVNRTAFKASELSREWSGKKTVQALKGTVLKDETPVALPKPKYYQDQQSPRTGGKDREIPVWPVGNVPALQHFLSFIQDLLRPEAQELADPFQRKKKKRRKLNR